MLKQSVVVFWALCFYCGCVSSPAKVDEPTKKDLTATSEAPPQDPISEELHETIKSGDDEAIYRAASAALAQSPNNVKALNAMGLYYHRKGQPLAAQLLFRKAISIQPDISELYSNLGLAQLQNKEKSEALGSFRKAVELNSRSINSINNLGSIYLEHRDFVKAYDVLAMGANSTRDVKFLVNFALACAETGKLDQAQDAYQDALKIAPSMKELLFNYSIFQISYQGKWKEGLETLDRLKLLGPTESMRSAMRDLESKAKESLK